MRPAILNPLFASATRLPGVGRKTAGLVERIAGNRVLDLLWHLPTSVVDRRYRPPVAEAEPGRIATLIVRVVEHKPGLGPRSPHRVRCADDSGPLDLIYFHAKRDWLADQFPVGAEIVVSGRVDVFQDRLQIAHPDEVGPVARLDEIARAEPVYPLTAGLTQRAVNRAIQAALTDLPTLDEWADRGLVEQRRWAPWPEAVRIAHAPAGPEDTAPAASARQRLAYDELLANQLALAVMRRAMRRHRGRALAPPGALRKAAMSRLPFTLTVGQAQALREIDTDMAAPERMLRLLQGDVGSGKTIVAWFALLAAVEAGVQAVLLAPTEILARQHHETLRPLAAASGIALAVLTGRDRGKVRTSTLMGLADGSIQVAVGTHALVQEDVAFRDLGLVVIDEQHRFGVHQRLALSAKGQATDVLVMTATPIPRTLQMTAYGDMDVSRLVDKPPGRTPIDTRAVPLDRLGEVVDAIGRQLETGAKAYWVCPLVEEGAALDVIDATTRHAMLKDRFGDRIGLIHGRMAAADKDAVMAAFADGSVDLLVATTVIEVGVDVPSATVMVIEHAERFGLAQLHQLRGRIGRGSSHSTCLLLYAPPLGETERARLATIRATDDGFRIAEEDLRLRGAGDMLGTRQSGLPEFRLADLAHHQDLLAVARDDAEVLLAKDPDLVTPRGQAARTLLYLFERDSAVRYLRSG